MPDVQKMARKNTGKPKAGNYRFLTSLSAPPNYPFSTPCFLNQILRKIEENACFFKASETGSSGPNVTMFCVA
jgi:hypothetical protein